MGAKLLGLCASCVLLASCHAHAGRPGAADAQRQINAALVNWQKAFEAKDVNGVMAMYATGAAVTAYDLVPPLQYKGADAYRKDYSDFFAQVDGPLHVDLSDTHIEADGNLAVAYGLERISGKLKGGAPMDIWVRYDSDFRKIDGHWKDIHDHVSVPVDLSTGKAALDLKP
jgi:ketosteroid isomerase-like protein